MSTGNAQTLHEPVLLAEVLAAATRGAARRGRHRRARRDMPGRSAPRAPAVLGIDRDPDALATARARLGDSGMTWLEAPYASPGGARGRDGVRA